MPLLVSILDTSIQKYIYPFSVQPLFASIVLESEVAEPCIVEFH